LLAALGQTARPVPGHCRLAHRSRPRCRRCPAAL